MKKIFLLLGLLFCSTVYSQNYYNEEFTKGTQATYKRLPWPWPNLQGLVIANSEKCSRIMTQPLCKNGQEVAPDYRKVAHSNDIDDSILKSIIKNVLSSEKLVELKEQKCSLFIDLIVEPTGLITEVGFLIFHPSKYNSLLLTITPDEYYQIEQQIKSKIWFTLDEYTRDTYQWIREGLSIKFKDI